MLLLQINTVTTRPRLKTFQSLAAQGNAEAQSNARTDVCNVQGVPQDYAHARQCCVDSRGCMSDALAQNNLAELYYARLGVPQDDVRSVYVGEPRSRTHEGVMSRNKRRKYRDDVARRMTPDQIAEAKRLTQQCLHGSSKAAE